MTDPKIDFELLDLSQDLLRSIKMNGEVTGTLRLINHIAMEQLESGLSNDHAKNLFWINLYNAYFQLFACRENRSKPSIFSHHGIVFSDIKLSLDDIEHGILRRYRWKYSLGYLPQFSHPNYITKLAVGNIDYRIHFALNCGAVSCPPILFYDFHHLDEQLDQAAATYLAVDTEIDHIKKQLFVSRIFLWFLADFGGFRQVKNVLSKYLQQDFSTYALKFKKYNWEPSLENFA